MSTADRQSFDIEAVLDDLYANEFNVALSWNHERGFRAVFGDPPIAKATFPTGGEAVRWLKDQALAHFPRSEFGRQPKPDSADRELILDQLCASHIAGTLSWTWDGGFYATLGEPKIAEKWSANSAGEALAWFRDQAILHYPGSEFAARQTGFGPLG